MQSESQQHNVGMPHAIFGIEALPDDGSLIWLPEFDFPAWDASARARTG